MSAVSMDLLIRGFSIDFANRTITVTFVLSKFISIPQTVTLDINNDISIPQFQTITAQVESIFLKWVARQ